MLTKEKIFSKQWFLSYGMLVLQPHKKKLYLCGCN